MIGTHAMVMAAGLGTRMRPLTEDTPKPLIEVAGKKLIDYTLQWLQLSGVTQLVVNTHYLADQVQTHVNAHYPGCIISHEVTLLETGGGITKALPHLGAEPFFVCNSDTICRDTDTSNLQRMRDAWHDGLDALLLLHPLEKAVGFSGKGDFFLDGTLTRRGEADAAPYVFTGTQLLHPRLFADAPSGAFSNNMLYDRALANGRIAAIVNMGEWFHVGTPEEKMLVEAHF